MNMRKHAIFHLPFDVDPCAIEFARLLNNEGFSIFGNETFFARVQNEEGIALGRSDNDSRHADILITVGDYSKNDQCFRCTGTSMSIDVDVASLENEIHMMTLVMIAAGISIRENDGVHKTQEVANYISVKPFLTALKNQKMAIAMKAVETAILDEEIGHTVAQVKNGFKSLISDTSIADTLTALTVEKPESIYAKIVARLDSVNE